MSHLSRAVALAVACLAILPSPALAAPWAPASIVAPPAPTGTSPSLSPVVAADGQGRLTAAWVGDGVSGFGIYTATRATALSGSWSAPARLGAALQPRDLRLVVNPAGQAVAGWIDDYPNLTQRLVTASRTAAGVWSAPALLPAVEAQYTGLELQLDGAGSTVGLWATAEGGLGTITQSLGGAPSQGGAGPVAGVNADGGAPFDLAIDAAGGATALYLDASGLGLHSATRTADGTWQAPQVVEQWNPPGDSATGSLEAPQLAINASGRAVAAWLRRADAGTGLQAAIRPAGGSWSASTPLTPISNLRYVVSSGVGIDTLGRATAAWDVVAFETLLSGQVRFWTEVRSMTAPAGGTSWSAVAIRGERRQTTFTPSEPDPDDPEAESGPDLPVYAGVKVAVGPGGSTAVTWLERLGTGATLAGSVRPALGTWEPAVPLASVATGDEEDSGGLTSSVVDAAGHATVLWVDGRTVRSRSIALGSALGETGPDEPAATTPSPADPTPADPAPTQPSAGSGVLAPPDAPAAAAKMKLVVAMYLVPRSRKCPAASSGTVSGVRTALKVKAARIRGKLRCKVTGIIPLAASVKAGTKVTVLVTAKGVKRKRVVFTATA